MNRPPRPGGLRLLTDPRLAHLPLAVVVGLGPDEIPPPLRERLRHCLRPVVVPTPTRVVSAVTTAEVPA